jgi:hypothetical protein
LFYLASRLRYGRHSTAAILVAQREVRRAFRPSGTVNPSRGGAPRAAANRSFTDRDDLLAVAREIIAKTDTRAAAELSWAVLA